MTRLQTSTISLVCFSGAVAQAGPATGLQSLEPTRLIDSYPAGVAYTYDLAGVRSWDALGSPNNETLSLQIGPHNRLATRVSWDVTIQTVGSSWLSEVSIALLDSPVGLTLTPGTDGAPGTGTYTSGGILDLAAIDPDYPFFIGPDGSIQMEVFESFDDQADAVDAVFLPGSTITFYFIPTPGSAVVLTAAAAAFARRRRN